MCDLCLSLAGTDPLHGMRQLLDLLLRDGDRVHLLLLELLDLGHQPPLLLLQGEVLLDQHVQVLVQPGMGFATQSNQLVLLQLVDLPLQTGSNPTLVLPIGIKNTFSLPLLVLSDVFSGGCSPL